MEYAAWSMTQPKLFWKKKKNCRQENTRELHKRDQPPSQNRLGNCLTLRNLQVCSAMLKPIPHPTSQTTRTDVLLHKKRKANPSLVHSHVWTLILLTPFGCQLLTFFNFFKNEPSLQVKYHKWAKNKYPIYKKLSLTRAFSIQSLLCWRWKNMIISHSSRWPEISTIAIRHVYGVIHWN